MSITPVTVQTPDQDSLVTTPITSPYSATWWTTQTITDIPGDSVGWLVSQGWQITNITYDNSTTPPTPYYAMSRESMQNWIILQTLLNSYTTAYNTAILFNDTRYNQVIENWTEMLRTSQIYYDTQVDEQNTHVALYLGDLDTYMTEVDALIEANITQLGVDITAADTALTAMDTKLSDLETNTTTVIADIEALLTEQEGYFTAYDSDVSTEQGTLGTDLSTFIGNVQPLLASIVSDHAALDSEIDALVTTMTQKLDEYEVAADDILSTMETDYSSHATTATEFLDDLGTTETARITEKFAATLATQLQQLTDRGLYSAGIAADITARNTRDLNEELAALNDRLNREKWENQHRLYGQQFGMRGAVLSGKERIHAIRQEVLRYHASQVTGVYSLLQEMRKRTAEFAGNMQSVQQAISQFQISTYSKVHGDQQEVSRTEMEQRNKILAMLQDAAKGIIAGKERYSTIKTQMASTLADHKHKMIVEKMDEFARRLEGLRGTHTENMNLMKYTIDERNKLLIGIYGFVERRDDVGPKWQDFAQIVAGLGDAGGGWLTP